MAAPKAAAWAENLAAKMVALWVAKTAVMLVAWRAETTAA